MKRIKYLLINLITILTVIVCFSCEREGVDTIILPTERYVVPITDIIPQQLINRVDDLHLGYDPPDITGGYIANPYVLTYSTLSHDSIPFNFGNLIFKFSNQTYENTISYESVQGDAEVNSPIAYIQGSGNNFTVYFSENKTSPSTGITVKTHSVITGKVSPSGGIANFKYAYIVADPGNSTIAPNTIRKFKDNDDLAEVYKW
ncbi:MAG: hypothetical protein LBP67_09480 [Bacteroidales bacterium]|jgi:hypothetical protein|nr:hypothetical protein [Bacteroidales bacterium]